MMMRDGSLLFFDRPESISSSEVRSRVASLEGAQITSFIGDFVVEFWLDFIYCGHQFSINNPMGELWFFVEDSTCPQGILNEIIESFKN